MAVIPHIIHSMWIDKVEYDNTSCPLKKGVYTAYELSWRTHHPSWDFRFWNRRKIEELWEHPQLRRWKPLYYKIGKIIMKCDLSRYAILYVYGGIYHDLDYICFSSFGDLIKDRDILMGYEPKENNDKYIGNCILGSAPGHPFWLFLLNKIGNEYNTNYQKGVHQTTGPGMLFMAVMEYNKNNKVITPVSAQMLLPLHNDGLTKDYVQDVPIYGAAIWADGTHWAAEDYRKNIYYYIFIALCIFLILIFFAIQYGKASAKNKEKY